MPEGTVLTTQGPVKVFFPDSDFASKTKLTTKDKGTVTKFEVLDKAALKKAAELLKQEAYAKAHECHCKDYEGQDYKCKVHEPMVECPKCRCIDAEREIPSEFPNITNYSCKVCGLFYTRLDADGSYQF